MIKSVCIFCGARPGKNPLFERHARELGTLLAEAKINIVYGGGHVGLMGVSADGALAAGGDVTGVIPQGLVDRELAHDRVTRLHVTESMHERKALMAHLSDAFVALPGGFGTLDELCEIVTWAQLGIHAKPVFLLNTAGYWDPFLAFLQEAVREEFVTAGSVGLLRIVKTPAEFLEIVTRRT